MILGIIIYMAMKIKDGFVYLAIIIFTLMFILSQIYLFQIIKQPDNTNYNTGIINFNDIKETKKEYTTESQTVREISAYNVGDVNQCDGDSCISANGENICEAIAMGYKRCAANFVPFGTHLYVDCYGICLVTDRLNDRYPERVDIAMSFDELEQAKQFGIQLRNVRIIKFIN